MAVLGERWNFLVVREVFNGVRRFDDMRVRTAIPRQVLTNRLALLSTQGILRKEPYQLPGERVRHEYRLTQKGLDLYPVLVAIADWGDRYLADPEGPPVEFVHADCGSEVHAYLECDQGHRIDQPRTVHPRPGPGAHPAVTTGGRAVSCAQLSLGQPTRDLGSGGHDPRRSSLDVQVSQRDDPHRRLETVHPQHGRSQPPRACLELSRGVGVLGAALGPPEQDGLAGGTELERMARTHAIGDMEVGPARLDNGNGQCLSPVREGQVRRRAQVLGQAAQHRVGQLAQHRLEPAGEREDG